MGANNKDNWEWLKDPHFRQAVLVTPKGPRPPKCRIKTYEDDITKALDYCSCYYPPVDGSEALDSCSAEELVRGLLKAVLDPESEAYRELFGAEAEK